MIKENGKYRLLLKQKFKTIFYIDTYNQKAVLVTQFDQSSEHK